METKEEWKGKALGREGVRRWTKTAKQNASVGVEVDDGGGYRARVSHVFSAQKFERDRG